MHVSPARKAQKVGLGGRGEGKPPGSISHLVLVSLHMSQAMEVKTHYGFRKDKETNGHKQIEKIWFRWRRHQRPENSCRVTQYHRYRGCADAGVDDHVSTQNK